MLIYHQTSDVSSSSPATSDTSSFSCGAFFFLLIVHNGNWSLFISGLSSIIMLRHLMRKCDEAKGEWYQEQEINFLPELPGEWIKYPPARWKIIERYPKPLITKPRTQTNISIASHPLVAGAAVSRQQLTQNACNSESLKHRGEKKKRSQIYSMTYWIISNLKYGTRVRLQREFIIGGLKTVY